MTNIDAFTNKILDEYAAKHDRKVVTGSLTSVKGHFTSRVYQLRIYDKASVLESYYIKESGDRSLQRFNDFIEKEYVNTRYVYDHFRPSSNLGTAYPITYSADHNAFAVGKIEGERLDKFILRHMLPWHNGVLVKQVLDLVVEWLDRFQEIDFNNSKIPTSYRERELAKLEFVKSRISFYLPEREKPHFAKIFDTMKDNFSKLEKDIQSNVIKHNDFAPWNLIYNGKRLTVIDYADCSVDFRHYDLLYFIHSLEKFTLKNPFAKRRIRSYQDYLATKCNLGDNILKYYKSYFYLQDIVFSLKGVQHDNYMKISHFLNFRRLVSMLNKTLFAKAC